MPFTRKLFALIILAGLVIPNAVSAHPSPSHEPAANASVSTIGGPTLQVIPAPATAVVAVTAQTASFCNVDAVLSANLVQDTGLINFNQSADCFTVQTALLSVPQQLAVTTAVSTAAIAVVDLSTTSWNTLQAAEPIPTSVPVLPVTGLFLLVAAAVLTFDSIKRAAQRKISNFNQALTLSQLQVLRC